MQRRSCTAEEKTKFVLELIRGEHEVNEIASRERLSPYLLRNWKSEFLDNATLVFDKRRDQRLKKVGQLSIEVDFLKDVLGRK